MFLYFVVNKHMEYVVGAAAPGSDEIEYVVYNEPGAVDYQMGRSNLPQDAVEYVVGEQEAVDYAPVEYEVGVDQRAQPVEGVESVVEFPYVAPDVLEEAPYEELKQLIKRSEELLARARSQKPGQGPPRPQPQPQPQPRPAQPSPQPPSPAAQAAQPVPVAGTIPILRPEQYERNAMSALAAMKAALGESV